MGWQDILFQLLIVVSGAPGSGFFVYNGAPGPGNPPVGWIVAPGITADPFGNTVTAVAGFGAPAGPDFGIDQSGNITLKNSSGKVIFLGRSSDGSLFVYDGVGESLGHLVASITNTGGTDPPGNTTQSGLTSYEAGTAAFVELINNNVNWHDTSTTSWQASAAIISSTPYLQLSQLGLGGGSMYLVLSTATDVLEWIANHPGTANTPETWQIPALGAGWATGSAVASQQPVRYRMSAEGLVETIGILHTTSATPAATLWTYGTGYQPSTAQRVPCVLNNNAGTELAAFLAVSTAGAVSITNAPTAVSQDVMISTRFPLT